MKINYIKINGFGKLKNKFIKFEDGVNIIYGENETGKSTIVKFLTSILYGVSKNKNGKSISDFDKYAPWDNSEFSGKINYERNNEEFEVFREFNRKNPKIFNVKGEDISKNFSLNKSKEIEFFNDQSKIDENTFLNTAIMEQENIEIGEKSAISIVQKLSNLVSTGDDNISYQKCINKIEKEQTENVGTDKTKNRPINIIENELNELIEEKKEIEIHKEKFNSDLVNREEYIDQLTLCQNQKMCLKSLKRLYDDFKLRNAEIDFKKKNENEYLQKLDQLKNQIDKIKNEDNAKSKSNIGKILIIILSFIICIILLAFSKMKLFSLIPLGVILIDVIIIFFNGNKSKKSKIEELEKSENEYKKIENEYNLKKKDREENEINIENEKNTQAREILNEYSPKLDKEFLEKIFEMNDVQLEKNIDEIENKFKNLSVKLQMLQNEIDDIDLKLEKLVIIEEELENKKYEKEELNSLNISYNIAKECLEEAYNEIKNNLSPKFENKLCEISSQITNGKYKNIILNDEKGLFVEVENGNYMPIERLSVGTIDELYLALRLSILEEISNNEKMPIIFDETFAYFDDKRLENVIRYLLENNYENQVLIFTCSDREEKILNKLKINYSFVNLNY